MAKSTTTRGKVAEIREPEPPNSDPSQVATAVLDPPEPEAAEIPQTPFDPPAPPAPKPKGPPRMLTFFDRVRDIAPQDWGARAKIKVYRIAPIINRLAGSEHKYITVYEEAVTEEKIKHDHGSGRYRLYLNFKNPGSRSEQEIDMVEFDVLDMQFPPKVPPGEWIEDPRNKQWAWARQPGMPSAPIIPPPPPTGIAELVNVLRVGSEMRKELRDELQPAPPAAAPAAPATPAPIAPDPFDTVAKIMGLRTNDPMITLLIARMDAQDKTLEAARLREFELQKELRTQQNPATAAPKTLLEQVKELAAVRTELKSLFGGASEDGAAPGRRGRFGWLEFARDVVPEIVNSPILNSIAAKISASGPAPQFNPAAPANGQPHAIDLQSFIQNTVNPALLEYFHAGSDGESFAVWMNDGYPARLPELQAIGEQQIFTLYKTQAPRADWAILTARGEGEFAKFVHEFCTWKPGPEQEPAADPGIIDLDADDDDSKEGDS